MRVSPVDTIGIQTVTFTNGEFVPPGDLGTRVYPHVERGVFIFCISAVVLYLVILGCLFYRIINY